MRLFVCVREFREYVRDVLEESNDISFDGYDEEMEVSFVSDVVSVFNWCCRSYTKDVRLRIWTVVYTRTHFKYPGRIDTSMSCLVILLHLHNITR